MKDMLTEMIEKRNFVENELEEMLRFAVRGGWLEYLRYGFDGTNEVVAINYRDGDNRFSSDVNVTGDSKWAIANDVMRAVAELYE